MSKSFAAIFPDPKQVLQLSMEEVAWVILEILNSMSEEEFRQYASHPSFATQQAGGYPASFRKDVMNVIVEGWAWIQRECLIAPRPSTSADFVTITRKGKEIASRAQLEAYRRANLLSGMLHPIIEQQSKAAFLRGEYETAIFNAFKEVEVAVRNAGGFSWKDLGIDLMNEAFKPKVGQLTDVALPEPEQLGLRNLFSGAIAYYKNPGSHRHFPTDPVEVAEILFFASLLLRITERGNKVSSATPSKSP